VARSAKWYLLLKSPGLPELKQRLGAEQLFVVKESGGKACCGTVSGNGSEASFACDKPLPGMKKMLDEGKGILMVSSDLDELMNMSHVIAVMNKGRIEQFGSPEEIYTRPQTHFVAEFVGSNNTPVLTVMQLDKLRVTFTIPTALALRLKTGQKVSLTFPNSNQKAVGKIESISPVTEAESDTVRVKVLIDNEEGKYRCGVRCAINLNRLP